MIGVVIWSSESSRKAVIWCEDQGPLAYLRGRDNLLEEADWPVPGDLLRLECETIGNLRQAHSARVLEQKVCPQLPDALLGKTNRPSSHLEIVSRNDSPKLHATEHDDDEGMHYLSSVVNS
ncbi:hypothetical protein [Paracoccus albus]|uniref:hypothetical protein n=1 Tax=Paracoccus albus TaxID=3017784 RepID=UPI0022F060D3|nr:hypothetical protein [Paracoccus albus]WBU59535.1 hypothetical protein PAF20_12285 [Paracoccus albus]